MGGSPPDTLLTVAGPDYGKRLLENRHGWDLRTMVHLDSAFYDVESFKRGRSSLRPLEREELGDVSGRSLLHLQCHFGMDTLSWARLGAHRLHPKGSLWPRPAHRSLGSRCADGMNKLG